MSQQHLLPSHISSHQQQPTGGGSRQSFGGPRRGAFDNNNFYPPTGGAGYAGSSAAAHATSAGTLPHMVPAGLQMPPSQTAAEQFLQVNGLILRGAPMSVNRATIPPLGNFPVHSAGQTFGPARPGMQNNLYQPMQNNTGRPTNYGNASQYGVPQTQFLAQQQPTGYNTMPSGYAYSGGQNNVAGQVSAASYGTPTAPIAVLSGGSMPPAGRPGAQALLANYQPATAQFSHVSANSGRSNSISGPLPPGSSFINPSFPSSAAANTTSGAFGQLYHTSPFQQPGARPQQPPTPGTTVAKRDRKPLIIIDPKRT